MKVTAKLKKLKVRNLLSELKDDALDKSAMEIRKKWIPKWMEDCGVDDPAKIDYTNPYIRLEWMLCDPYYLLPIGRESDKSRLWPMLTDDEKEIYDAHYHVLEGSMTDDKLKDAVRNAKKS